MKLSPSMLGACMAAAVCVAAAPAFANNFTGVAKLPGTMKARPLPSGPATPPLHLQCVDYPATQLPTVIVSTSLPGAVVITNNTTRGIGANTRYTYVVNGSTGTYLDHDSLGPGGHLVISPTGPFVVVAQTSCDASVPG